MKLKKKKKRLFELWSRSRLNQGAQKILKFALTGLTCYHQEGTRHLIVPKGESPGGVSK